MTLLVAKVVNSFTTSGVQYEVDQFLKVLGFKLHPEKEGFGRRLNCLGCIILQETNGIVSLSTTKYFRQISTLEASNGCTTFSDQLAS